MKFGGTSVGDADRMIHVADIICTYQDKQPIVVVSAMSGVTNTLVEIVQLLQSGNTTSANNLIQGLEEKHIDTFSRICNSQQCKIDLYHHVVTVIQELKMYVQYVQNNPITPDVADVIVSFGERLSARIIAEACNMKGLHSQAVDSSRLIVTTQEYGNAKTILSKTKQQVEFILRPLVEKGIIPIITGFFGKTKNGKIATLGRGGSDYTASILGYATDAERIVIWKEVNGVYTKDPLTHQDAELIPHLTYDKAAEMARAGAKVLHQETMEPAKKKAIPIWVKNTFKPDIQGTQITK